MSSTSPLRDATVLVVNLHRRFAGVSATILALVPVQQRSRSVAVLDRGALGLAGTIRWLDLLRHGWSPPAGTRRRIWHARRAGDLLLGLVLRYLLFQPWSFVYTSPSPRRHGLTWRGIVGRADAIIAVTERAASFLDRHDAVIGHGVDTDAFVPPVDKRAAWRESGLPGRYGIGVFGRIRPNKGTHLFVDAMCRLLPRHPEFTAVISGLCLPSDRSYREDLERRIAAAGLSERIVFLGDLDGAQIKLWYRRVALCVSPSLSEGFGLTPLEAMASGAAAVTSRAGAYEQMIVPGVNGTIVDTGDLEQLVAALEPLLADPERLLALGANARRLALERHSIRGEVAGIEAVYERVLARR
ncbi:MAG: glycosyltransferase family 4 protein [Planctomycetaceae bacterium]|nr:glycosyltransferase family 4 protein [Planctomycetaceae bacterium]